mgnify:CR=1 FL=1
MLSKVYGNVKEATSQYPICKAIANMLTYAKFLKEIISNKQKFEEFATIPLTEKCNAVLQNHLLIKMKDLESFIVPCHFENTFIDEHLCDLGSSVNLMP